MKLAGASSVGDRVGTAGTLHWRFPYLETPSKSKGYPLETGGSQGHTPLLAQPLAHGSWEYSRASVLALKQGD